MTHVLPKKPFGSRLPALFVPLRGTDSKESRAAREAAKRLLREHFFQMGE